MPHDDPNQTRETILWCDECMEREENPGVAYECGECGVRFPDEGNGSRCDSCNRFSAKVSERACSTCGADLACYILEGSE